MNVRVIVKNRKNVTCAILANVILSVVKHMKFVRI